MMKFANNTLLNINIDRNNQSNRLVSMILAGRCLVTGLTAQVCRAIAPVIYVVYLLAVIPFDFVIAQI